MQRSMTNCGNGEGSGIHAGGQPAQRRRSVNRLSRTHLGNLCHGDSLLPRHTDLQTREGVVEVCRGSTSPENTWSANVDINGRRELAGRVLTHQDVDGQVQRDDHPRDGCLAIQLREAEERRCRVVVDWREERPRRLCKSH